MGFAETTLVSQGTPPSAVGKTMKGIRRHKVLVACIAH